MRTASKLFFSFTSLLLMVSTQAKAEERACCYEDHSNWYVGLSGMGILPNEVSLDESPATFGNMSYDLGTGFGGSGVIGYQFFPNASIELEVLFQSSSVNKTHGFTPTNGTKGTQENLGVMINHRWIYRQAGMIQPYLGVGGGLMQIQSPFSETVTFGPDSDTQGIKDTVLAYQLMAGANFPVPNTKFEFYAGYRYIGTQKGETKFAVGSGYKQSFSADSHNIEFGGRLHF